MIGHNLIAFCNSRVCNPGNKDTAKIKKTVGKNVDYCPDCKSALEWVALGSRRKTLDSYKRGKSAKSNKAKA